MENWTSHTQFQRDESCASAHIRTANQKWNCDELELAKEKRGSFLYHLFFPKGISLKFMF